MKKYIKLILSIGLLLILGHISNKFNYNLEKDKKLEDFEIVRKFLLGEDKQITDLKNSKKPILWIHLNYQKNSRDWDSFFSRSNNELNLPYYFFTLKSIISKNNDDFNICIIDDNTFCKLLNKDDFSYNLEQISEPEKNNIRLLGLTKLLYNYGGLIIPPSFVCFNSLKDINNIINNNRLIFGENKNYSVSYDSYPFIPSCEFIGSLKNNKHLNDFILYLDNIIKNNYTDEIKFNGNINNYLLNQYRNQKIDIIKSEYLGIKDKNNKEIILEELFNTSIIEFNQYCYGMYINNDKLLKKNNLNWFCYLSKDDILNSDIFLCKLLISN